MDSKRADPHKKIQQKRRNKKPDKIRELTLKKKGF